jgi:TadE-like protein
VNESERAQASVELVVLLPLLAVLAAAAWQGVLVGWTALSAQQAARAGARAALGGEPAGPAVAHALPASMRDRVLVQRAGGRLQVRVAVPVALPWFSATVDASAVLVEPSR